MNLQETNPGATTTPSILSVVVDQCLEDFAPFYRYVNDLWLCTCEGSDPAVLTDSEMREDISKWVASLEGNDAIGAKIVMLIRGNKGWPEIIARRVMNKLREYVF